METKVPENLNELSGHELTSLEVSLGHELLAFLNNESLGISHLLALITSPTYVMPKALSDYYEAIQAVNKARRDRADYEFMLKMQQSERAAK